MKPKECPVSEFILLEMNSNCFMKARVVSRITPSPPRPFINKTDIANEKCSLNETPAACSSCLTTLAYSPLFTKVCWK